MENPSQINSQSIPLLESQIRECFGRVVYSHKTHEKCADILLNRLSNIKLWQIILSAVTTGGFVAALCGVGNIANAIGIIISAALLILNAYTKNYDLGELSQKHKQAANDLWFIREKYLSLLTDLSSGFFSVDSIRNERDNLLEELHNVYTGAPTTTIQAYRKAQKALKKYEDMSFSDAEIDAFLPSALKKCDKQIVEEKCR